MIYAMKQRKHGEVKSNMMESRVNPPFGKDYGFNCTCNTGFTKVPKLQPPLWMYLYSGMLLVK